MRSGLLVGAAWILVSTAAAVQSPATAQPSDTEPTAQTLIDAIAELDKSDPSSPAALNARLEYADFLIAAHNGDCRQRLDEAQSQLDTATADPAFEVVLPSGQARQADLEYRIHTARASCGPASSQRQEQLHQALAAAQRAVDLYRDALDYESMATMQFNVGVTQRLLGNDTAAVAALRSVIEMDQEYGFHDDAKDNYNLLAQWTGQGGGGAPAGMQDIPTRSTTLKFGWSICNAHVAMDLTYASVMDGRVARYRGSRTFERTYRAGLLNWEVADQPGQVAFSIHEWPRDGDVQQELALAFVRSLPQVPDIEISKTGEFARANGLSGLSAKLTKATEALFRQHAEPAAHAAARLSPALAQKLDVWFAPATIEQKAVEDYNFDTAIWIGATLEQGVWYKMTAPLIVPGSVAVAVSHDIEFAYTRQVPCNADTTERSCVELVLRARPDPGALEEFLVGLSSAMNLPHGRQAYYGSETYMRIVTDPNTLITHVRDVRKYWHLSFDGAALGDIASQFERVQVTQSVP